MKFSYIWMLLAFTSSAYADLDKIKVCYQQNINVFVEQCEALVELYNGTNGDQWDKNEGWGSPDVSTWHGVMIFRDPRKAKADITWIDLGDNNLIGTIPKSISNLNKVRVLVLGKNKLYGQIPSEISGMKSLFLAHLGNNYLSGKIPHSLNKMKKLASFEASDNFLSGRLPPVSVVEGRLSPISYVVEQNAITGDFAENLRLRRGGNFYSTFMHGGITLPGGERPEGRTQFPDQNVYDVSLEGNATYIPIPRMGGNPGVVYIFPMKGNIIDRVSGCGGVLNGYKYILKDGSLNGCEVKISTRICGDNDFCHVELGKENGIPKAALEVPSPNNTLSGLANLRGWMYMPELNDLFPKLSNNGSVYINGVPYNLNSSTSRKDILDAFGESVPENVVLGGSQLFYSGNIKNGENVAEYVNNAGFLVSRIPFNAFTPEDRNGKLSYIKGVERSLRVYDFPFPGSDVVLRFNQSEQVFSIVDQFLDGKSTRSSKIHYPNQPPFYIVERDPINGVPYNKFEYPSASFPLAGVSTIRGWSLSGIYEFILNGKPLAVSKSSREDVRKAMDVHSSVSGLSVLEYSGNLPNGLHRILMAKGSATYEYVVFESFTPLDILGRQAFITGVERRIEVNNFPFAESTVLIEFDEAGQNFKIVDQYID
ncbi:hypothetical protein [Pseudoteredinibacter isoporae]|uniref:non-specific serine/threonine protein kinase n=1 Tax=Pseudoteredinibacter isoporae TaxID=570281 RepID=A0A7X0JV29_9GAMM|nr:hypothetical protein [Pseudoteredinibacter isoporae]MBB6521841.1 hypothetical protein [Pseudoteredinibacter isoporae]NHO87385.1 hypothetical protein [Pseudoteredinibacter isoporae]NIB23209.1 hypothetical protein [Pseudoteredinibacter isoporae]